MFVVAINPLTSAPLQQQQRQSPSPTVSVKNDFFSDLAALNTVKPVSTATYTGGILQPNSPSSSSSPSNTFINNNIYQIATPTSPIQQKTNRSIDLDPYAALRDLSLGSKPAPSPPMMKMDSNDSLSFGDFQKSPTTSKTTISSPAFKTTSNNALFGDLDPLFKR